MRITLCGIMPRSQEKDISFKDLKIQKNKTKCSKNSLWEVYQWCVLYKCISSPTLLEERKKKNPDALLHKLEEYEKLLLKQCNDAFGINEKMLKTTPVNNYIIHHYIDEFCAFLDISEDTRLRILTKYPIDEENIKNYSNQYTMTNRNDVICISNNSDVILMSDGERELVSSFHSSLVLLLEAKERILKQYSASNMCEFESSLSHCKDLFCNFKRKKLIRTKFVRSYQKFFEDMEEVSKAIKKIFMENCETAAVDQQIQILYLCNTGMTKSGVMASA